MEAHTQGREVILPFNGDVGAILRKACEHDADGDAVHLARAATLVRRDMFSKKMEFNGSFSTTCQEQSVPNSQDKPLLTKLSSGDMESNHGHVWRGVVSPLKAVSLDRECRILP